MKNIKIFTVCILLFLILMNANAQEVIELNYAIALKLINVDSITSNGLAAGDIAHFTVTNPGTSDIILTVDPFVISSSDPNVQRQAVVRIVGPVAAPGKVYPSPTVTVRAGKTVTFVVFGVCIDHQKDNPIKGMNLSINGSLDDAGVDNYTKSAIEYIKNRTNISNNAAQGLVWANSTTLEYLKNRIPITPSEIDEIKVHLGNMKVNLNDVKLFANMSMASPITNITAAGGYGDKIYVSWNVTTYENIGGYKVYVSDTQKKNVTTLTPAVTITNPADTNAIISGLTIGKNYIVFVTPVDIHGNENTEIITTAEVTPTPSQIKITNINLSDDKTGITITTHSGLTNSRNVSIIVIGDGSVIATMPVTIKPGENTLLVPVNISGIIKIDVGLIDNESGIIMDSINESTLPPEVRATMNLLKNLITNPPNINFTLNNVSVSITSNITISFNGTNVTINLTKNLEEVLDALQKCTIEFDDLPEDVLGRYNQNTNTITLDNSLINNPAAIAQVLVHEGEHANLGSDRNSIDEEYLCFLKEAAVWRALEGKGNEDCENNARVMALHEDRAKRIIKRLLYPELPERPPGRVRNPPGGN